MGFSVAISGGIVCVTIITVFSIVFAMTGQIYEINSSRTQSSNLDIIIAQTDTNINYTYAQSGSNLVSLTLENTGNEKIWDYSKFSVIVTYNASIGGVPTLTTEKLTYNSAQAFAQTGSDLITQFSRPDEDLSKGGWTDTAGGDSDTILYDEVNESARNDANFARSKTFVLGADSDIWTIGLQGVVDPESSSNHVVSYVFRKNTLGVSTVHTTIRLLQGGTQIGSWTDNNIGTTFTSASKTLTAGEANSITDYSNLSLEITSTYADGLVDANEDVSWVQFSVPQVGIYDCSGVSLSSGQWTIDRISQDLQDPKILNTEEDGKVCIKLSNNVYPNSYVTVVVTTDVGKTDSDRFRA
ncbi:MAG: hypothetical protein ACT4NT_01945 [Nitrososphaerota archaeon]